MSKRKKKSETLRKGQALAALISIAALGCRAEGAPEPEPELVPESGPFAALLRY